MCIKLDLRKAFDTLNHTFLYDTLQSMGFDSQRTNWIKMCLNATFALSINREYTPSFPSSNGIR